MTSIKLSYLKNGLLVTVLTAVFASCASSEALPPAEEVASKDVQAKAEHSTDGLALAPVDGHDEPRPYDETRDAWADVDAATAAALDGGKSSIIIMGANWCHDSRALAAHFEKPRFQTLLSEHYEYVYVDMGIRNRNLDIPASYGIDKVEGTPTIIILGPKGEVLNLETAKTWRNAADRTEDAIYDEFAAYAIDGFYTAPEPAPKADTESDDDTKAEPAADTPPHTPAAPKSK